MPDQEMVENRDLVAIKDWLCRQPHLPHEVDDILLLRFLSSAKYSLEKAKKTIDLFFTVRSNAPELFCKRDPWAPEIKRIFDVTDMLPLPNKTKENYKVFIYRLSTTDLDLFNFVDAVKTFFMLADTRLTEDQDVPAGEVPIFDSANVTLKFIGKINLSALRKYMIYTQEAMPIRLKQVHVINAPSYIGKLYAICKPFLKTEVAKLIKFHEPNSDTLYKDIPQEILPSDYGGEAGSVEQIKREWIKKMEAKRDWFLTNDKRWAVDESQRPSSCQDARVDKLKDLPGSFRSLALD
ncbi:alpha-tocopherol transfer protein-like [Bombyx mandarina]|uniref:Alpha-tocopherol transfer protein-like n=1 Tax=Bombyx mandarina TaxID=7092 RepID=A0A6J2KRP0_BOMMA|nr:alpha-tocopherol transfer protein-like [Bombyx mandarina]XP_028043632.1 alpha-tocopherol transfer protein-like [Bombyx mandarina]